MASPILDGRIYDGPFPSPLSEAERFATNVEAHLDPERRQSGNLPQEPDVPQSSPGNESPVRYTNG